MDNSIVLSNGGEKITTTMTPVTSQCTQFREKTQVSTLAPSLNLASLPQPLKPSSPPASPSTRTLLNACIIVLTVTSSMIVNTANSTSVSIALPTIEREMNLEPAQLQWIMSAYPLSSGCLFLICGRLADVHGRKRTFSIGSLFLAIFTLACGFSNDVITLDILRGIQGIGAAATIPASLGILAHAFPPSHARSLAFATFSAGAPIGALFGSALGGVLTEFTHKTWRSSFYLLAGLTFLCFLGGLISIDNDLPSEEVDKRIDWLGAFLVTTGLVLIVFVLSQGELAPQGWSTPYIIVFLILGVILMGLFFYWQHYLEKIHENPESPFSLFTPPPLLKPSIWTRANGRIAAMVVIAFTSSSAFLGWTYWVQLYFQNYMHYTVMQTVVRLLPMFVSGLVCNAFVGFMAAYIPIVWLLVVGAGATTLACLLFAIIVPSTMYWAYAFVATVLSVMGADFVFVAGALFIAKFSLPHEQSVAGALFNTMMQLGTALGITVTTVVFNRIETKVGPDGDTLRMYRAAQWTAFAFGIISTILSIVFFRGVGVVGHRAPKLTSVSENAKGERVGAHADEKVMPFEDTDNVWVGDGDVTGTTMQVPSSPEQMRKFAL